MSTVFLFLAYWFVCIIVWWFCAGRELNQMYKDFSSDVASRRLIVFVAIMDMITAPVLSPIILIGTIVKKLTKKQ